MSRQFDDFRKIADDLARDIGDGIIKPGDRLLPQRDFAHQHGIAASTAGRVYGELRRRGLITGEVGRGSFVRSSQRLAGGALIDLAENSINLELVFPPLGEHAAAIGAMIGDMMLSSDWTDALGPVGAIPSEIMQRSVADFLSDGGWQPAPGSICLAGNGKQAIAASMSAVAERGSRVGVEALTYPVIRGIASGLGIELVPLAMDGQGLSLEALEASLARDRLTALYLQPSLHNPTGATMPPSRRAALGRLLERHDLPVIEDGIYRFLVDEAPLASFAPDHVIFIDSLSKRVAPGLSLGIIAAPPRFAPQVTDAIRHGVWMPTGLQAGIARRLLESDLPRKIVAERRHDAARRQAIARKALSRLAVKGDPRAYHLWLDLPRHWRGEAFAAHLLRRGIGVTAGGQFAAQPGHAPNGVRMALASPPLDDLERALAIVARIALEPARDEVE